MSDALRLVDGVSVQDLGRYAGRARALDAEGAMRLVASGRVLAAWCGVLPGSGILGEGTVVGLRTFGLAEEAECDVTVPLGAVTDRTARPGAGATFEIPPTRALAPWSALTPPRSGWERAGEVPGDHLADVARAGIAEIAAAVAERGAAAGFTRGKVWARALSAFESTTGFEVIPGAGARADTSTERTSRGFEVIPGAGAHADTSNQPDDTVTGRRAAVTWADGLGELSAGGAFAAYGLGFLAPGEPVTVFRNGRWTRLSAPGGHILLR